MAQTMFFEALQSYYAPVATLVIFMIILYTDKLFTKHIRRLFLVETVIIAVIIMATWADRCLSVMDLDNMAWKLRTSTTFINFALSPFSPMILGLIYNKNSETKINPIYYTLAIGNILLCIGSLFNGWIFDINSENIYSRGPLFIVPFLVSGFYLLSMLFFTMKQKDMPSRKVESFYLILAMIVTGIASILEVAFVIRFMIWSTTEITVILYFLVLTSQKILYDPLTGIYSSVAYAKRVERIQVNGSCTIAMIDMNNLKYLNDKYGHTAGNAALINMTKAIVRIKSKGMQLYRYAGDEFMLIDNKAGMGEKMKDILEKAQQSCQSVEGEKVSFAFGIAEYSGTADFQECIDSADQAMYMQKKMQKQQNILS